ncbi:MAG TPA: hypothetical protein VNO32_65760 [Candidatus Acidoferrum sp.]|jgi:hypothetical protein|nr:hypothetical protein [Candidatus Acidoferrum sp.]
MAVIAFLGMAVVGAFFLYALVQFSLEEKHLRQRRETRLGFPVISAGQIVMPPQTRREDSENQDTQHESGNRR